MEICQDEWKDLLECKKSQALGMTEETLSKAFDFTFDKLLEEIDPKETISSKLSTFILHNMHKMMVSEKTNHVWFYFDLTRIFFQSFCIGPMIQFKK